MRWRAGWVVQLAVLVLSAAGAGGVPASAGATVGPVKPTVRHIGLLYVQTARAGSLRAVKGTANRFVLRLVGVSRQVVWFSDRPARQQGVIPVRGLGPAWKGFGFADDPPNAVLTLLAGDPRADTVVLKLGKPHYAPSRHTMTYRVRRLAHATGNLASHEPANDRRVPRHFAHASLFIDDATAPVVNGCVIQPYTVCSGADLAGVHLTYAYLLGADLSGANFDNASIFSSALDAANLSDAQFVGTDLSLTTLDEVDLAGANLTGADLTGVQFTDANLSNTNLTNVTYCQTRMPDGTLNNPSCMSCLLQACSYGPSSRSRAAARVDPTEAAKR